MATKAQREAALREALCPKHRKTCTFYGGTVIQLLDQMRQQGIPLDAQIVVEQDYCDYNVALEWYVPIEG